jgi:hypothetical protein
MRQVIASLFILLLCSQVIPLKEIGKLLFKSQTTEEIHPEETASVDDEAVKLFTHAPGPGYAVAAADVLTEVIAVHIHHAETLPDNHSRDIFTPPPNC